MHARAHLVVPGAVFVVALVVYLTTLARGVLGGDAGELQFVPIILSLSHPTGYPFQTLLHKLWSLLPFGSPAYGLNLLDAALAAIAVAMVARASVALTRQWLPSALGALAFAFGELWWAQAVSGDKYTLNGLFLALVLFLYVRWQAERERRTGRDVMFLRALALAYGLSLTHHRSMLLVLPALGIGLALEKWRPASRREAMMLVMLFASPLVLYLYVPWAGSRGLPPGAWRVDTPAAFVEFLLDRGYTSQIRPDAALAGRLAEEARVLLRSYGVLGALLGLVGLVWSFWTSPRVGIVLAFAFVPQAVLGASYLLESNYALPRHWVFYLPAFLIWAIWIAAGLAATRQGLQQLARRQSDTAAVALASLFIVVQLGTVWARTAEGRVRAVFGAETLDGYRQDLQRSAVAERFGRLALDRADRNAIVVGDWEQATVLWYLQRVEGLRPDLSIRYPIETLDDGLRAARERGSSVYVTRTLPGLADRGIPSSDGPLLRLLPGPPPDVPSDATRIGVRLEGGMTLAGIAYHTPDPRPGRGGGVALFWRADQRPNDDYSVSVRLIDAAGGTHAQHDERHPALGTSPTSRWQADTVVGDYHELTIGNRLRPGRYHVVVVMYRPEPLRNLRVLDATAGPGGDNIVLPPIDVRARDAGPLDLLLGR